MRRFPALLGAAALVAAVLAGCTPAADGGCAPVYDSGDASSLITATGKVGSTPTVEFPTPLITRSSQVSTLVEGSGATIATGSQVDYDSSAYLGSTGEQLSGSDYDPAVLNLGLSGLDESTLSKALVCVKIGERLAVTAKASDLYAADTLSGANIDPDDTIVVVLDVIAAFLGKADGVNQLPKDGMPTVVTAVDGRPGISTGLVSPPSETESAAIKAGDGVTIAKDDRVVVAFSLWNWAGDGSDPTEAQSTWDSGTATTLPMTTGSDGLPAGIVNALVGQKVGGQVLLLLAPGDEFDPTTLGSDFTADSTAVFVFDLLGVQK